MVAFNPFSESWSGSILPKSRVGYKAVAGRLTSLFQKNVRWWPELGYQQKGSKRLFTKFGEVVDCTIKMDPNTGLCQEGLDLSFKDAASVEKVSWG